MIWLVIGNVFFLAALVYIDTYQVVKSRKEAEFWAGRCEALKAELEELEAKYTRSLFRRADLINQRHQLRCRLHQICRGESRYEENRECDWKEPRPE